jgi:glycosyltransferase involved in cell wall biosynthesis
VAGDAAVLVDPDSVEDMARGMARALLDPALRSRLVAAGHDRAARYSWTEMARGIRDFVELTLARPNTDSNSSQ